MAGVGWASVVSVVGGRWQVRPACKAPARVSAEHTPTARQAQAALHLGRHRGATAQRRRLRRPQPWPLSARSQGSCCSGSGTELTATAG